MPIIADGTQTKPSGPGEGSTTPWIGFVVQQAEFAYQTVDGAVHSFIAASRSRLSEIQATSSAHLIQTIDSLQELNHEYHVYEDVAFGKVKEGILVAASHPLVTSGIAFSVGVVGFKRPRRFLYHKILRLFISEASLLSRADNRAKELRKSIDLLKGESEKLENRASQAEEEMNRGMTKLRQAGKQIQGVIGSAYKIERQAAGLKDILRELPRVEASRFRSLVSKVASEARKERKALSREVSKISNYGIPI